MSETTDPIAATAPAKAPATKAKKLIFLADYTTIAGVSIIRHTKGAKGPMLPDHASKFDHEFETIVSGSVAEMHRGGIPTALFPEEIVTHLLTNVFMPHPLLKGKILPAFILAD